MSIPNGHSVGSVFKGVSKGKINYSGKNLVNSDKNINVGSSFEGTQEEKSEINFGENNQLNVVTQEKTDQNTELTEPSTAKLEDFKLEPNEYKGEIGPIVGQGSVTVVNKLRGNATTNLTCHANVTGQNRPIGDVIVAQDIAGAVNFNSDINVSLGTFRMQESGFHINGHMTIFNQEFENSRHYRAGSSNDVESLTTTFNRFGIEPSVKLDQKYEEIVKEIDMLSTTDFSSYKLFVCVYMSHGHKNGQVSAADKEFNLRTTIIDPIIANKSLNGIPKIFIAVACRGDNNYEENDSEEFDGHITSTANGIDYSNHIVSYSTYEGHVSKRTRGGTYFIQSLCDNINEDNGDTKIHSLFAKVNGKLANMYKQVPMFETSMSDICFKDLASTPN